MRFFEGCSDFWLEIGALLVHVVKLQIFRVVFHCIDHENGWIIEDENKYRGQLTHLPFVDGDGATSKLNSLNMLQVPRKLCDILPFFLMNHLPPSPITTLKLREFLDPLMAMIRSGDSSWHASVFTLSVSIEAPPLK